MADGTFTAAEKADCAEREVRQRRRVYPRLIEAGRLTTTDAAKQIAMMEEIAAEYRRRADEEAAKARRL